MGQIRMRVDDSELAALQADLGNVADELMPEVKKVTERGASRIQRGWADRWSGHPDIKHLPRAIDHDITKKPYAVDAEIGADRRRLQGVLAHLIEFGTLTSPPIPGGQPALDAEEPRYVAELERAAMKVLKGVKKRHGG